MVRGLDIFKKYFEQYPENYVIIGGTACDIIIDEAGFVPRATKDIDIILVVEAISSEFDLPENIQAHVNQFAELVEADLPDKAIFKEMGLSNIDPNIVFGQFKKSFKVRLNEA
jgi:hypothetical protein